MFDIGNIYYKLVTDLSDMEGGGRISCRLLRDNYEGYMHVVAVPVSS